MGYLPKMRFPDGIQKTVQLRFGGYDRSAGRSEASLYDTENMTAERFPALSSRKRRRYTVIGEVAVLHDANGVLLRITPTGEMYYGHLQIGTLPIQSSHKTAVQFGRNVLVFPDKVMLNLAYRICGRFETLEELQETIVTPSPGDAYMIGSLDEQWKMDVYAFVQDTWQPNGKLLQPMESSTPEVFATFKNGTLYGVPAKDNTIFCEQILWEDYFEVGDAVEISGCNQALSNNKIAIIREIEGHELRFYENIFARKLYPACKGPLECEMGSEVQDDTRIIYAFVHNGAYHIFTLPQGMTADDVLVMQDETAQILHWYRNDVKFSEIVTQRSVVGEIPDFHQELFFEDTFEGDCDETSITLARKMPELSFCFADENRLWGVQGSTIYASKLGDARNFYTFEGLSTDSYSVTVQTPGDFTAAVCYAGYPTFFKEDRINKLYGSAPQNYQLSDISAIGVKRGCEKSLAIAADTLFYLSPVGVMAYSGSYPESVSHCFGEERFCEAVGGSDSERYYCCMRGNGAKTLFVYDTRYGIWIKEQELIAKQFVNCAGSLFMLQRTDGDDTENRLWEMTGLLSNPEQTEEEGLRSVAEFGDITMQRPNRKSVHRVQLRIEANATAQIKIYIRYDSTGEWNLVSLLETESKKSYYLPILPRRCDHFRLRIVGAGDYEISSLALDVSHGSEIF